MAKVEFPQTNLVHLYHAHIKALGNNTLRHTVPLNRENHLDSIPHLGQERHDILNT